MLATGWNWPDLQATPERVVQETMMYQRIRAEAEIAKLKETNGGAI